jgi:hypothetical protein
MPHIMVSHLLSPLHMGMDLSMAGKIKLLMLNLKEIGGE